jgi:ferredoxin-NADP reductase
MPAMEPIRLPVTSRQRPAPPRALPPLFTADVFDFWASRVSRTWSWNRPLARIVDRRPASRDAVTLVLQPNRHFRGFVAGQHVNVTVEIDGRRLTRPYSPSAPPQRDGRIEITVKAVEGGRVSQHLVTQARVGDVLGLGPAFGAMALPADDAGPLLLLAAGSGITPLMALVRSLPVHPRTAPVTLLYWARNRAELCFVDELRALAAQRTDFRVRFLLTRETAEATDEGEGRLDAAHVGADGDAAHVFACGPAGFVDQARALLAAGAKAFIAEAFTPPVFANDDTGTVAVTLSRSGRTLTLPRGQALLAALEAEGVVPDSGCRMGICNTCACGKRSGATRHLGSGVIDNEPASALRLCVHAATSDLELDL